MSSTFLKLARIPAFSVGLLMILIFAQSISAQETRGTIRGTITDPNEQAVPNASVKIIDPARGTTVSMTTNDEGFYQAVYLVPGTYQIVVEAPGFKKTIRDNVLLQIGAVVQINVPLEIGGAQETVNVTADLPQMNTENGSLGQVIDARRLEDLPLVHGDPYKLIGLAPGATHTGSQRLDRPFEPTHIVGYAVDGTRGNRSDLTIDGAPSTATANANEVIASYVPPSDIVQEFKVQTATFDSQFGNTEGGVTSISIKSGTNDLHGSAYYFGEPGSWAANDFFGNSRGQARPETKSDRFGGYISGPVVLPWLYNGKNKTFFLFGYEGIRDARPRFDAGNSVYVPTDALRSGNFSSMLGGPLTVTLAGASNCAGPAGTVVPLTNYDGSTVLGGMIYNPLTSQTVTRCNPVTGTVQTKIERLPFAGNILPVSPIAAAIMQHMGQPKHPGLLGNIFDSTLTEVTKPYDNFTFRVDQNITNNNRLFVRGSYYDRSSLYNRYTDSPYVGVNFLFKARQGVIDDVHTFNSTTFLNLRYGYNRFIRGQDQQADAQGFDVSSLGFGQPYLSIIPPEDIRRFPRFDFPANTVLGNGMSNEFRPVDTHSVAAVLNKIVNTHSMKFGGEFRAYREDDSFASNDQTGQFVFNNTYTRQASDSGTGPDTNGLQSLAAFVLGYPSTTTIVRRADYSEYSHTYGFFFQDDWKVNKRLTLNLGIRYEVETPLVERQNKSVSGFEFDYVQPIQSTVRTRLAANPIPGVDPNINVLGGLMFAGIDGGDGLYKTPKNTWLPRFGVAYQFDNKTVVRAGVGMFAGFLGERRGDVIQPGYTQSTTARLQTLSPGIEIPYTFSNAFTSTTILEPVGSALGRQTSLGQNISFFNQNPKVSKQTRWQIGVQRELFWGFVGEAVYVGNYGSDIEIVRNINALPNQYLNTDNSRTAAMTTNNTFLSAPVPNPFAGLLPGSGLNGSTIARQQLLRPFPQFGDVLTTVNDGKSWYHAGQFTLQKRMSQGYTFGVAYTWSKWLQATEYLNQGDALPTKMISDQDAPHRIAASGIWELPFGKGKSFLSDGDILDRIVGGWQIQGVYQFQTGFPVAFGTFNVATGATSGDLFYNGGDISLPPDQRTTAQWFNTDVFTSVLNNTNTNATPVFHLRTLPYRFSDVRVDNINNVDLSILKNTRINEKMRIQFKLDLINAFNEPYFPAPVVNQTSARQLIPVPQGFGTISASNQNNYARRLQYGIKFLF